MSIDNSGFCFDLGFKSTIQIINSKYLRKKSQKKKLKSNFKTRYIPKVIEDHMAPRNVFEVDLIGESVLKLR